MNRSAALIFDLDGTLINSLRDIGSALNHALNRLNLPRADLHQVQSWVGDGMPALCQRAAPDAEPRTLTRLMALTQSHYRRHCVDTTRPYHNILQMLDLLQCRRCAIAVLSNKPHAFAVHVLHQLDLARYFTVIRGYRSEQDKKPAPAGAVDIAQRLGVRPEDTFMVGDSAVDIDTARNAGMIAVAVSWGLRDKEVLLAAGPDFWVDDPLEIPALVEDRANPPTGRP